MEHAAVAVVGAGPAGIGAAVAAARAGVDVVLIERSDMLGGLGSRAEVGTLCGVARCGRALADVPAFDNPGFAGDFTRSVAARCGTTLVRNDLGLTFLPYRPELFEQTARAFVQAAGTVRCIHGEPIVGVLYDEVARRFTVQTPTRSFVSAAVVDCSGDAAVSTLLGIPTEEPQQRQAAALVFQLSGLPVLSEAELGFLVRKTLREAALAGRIPERMTYVSMVPGSLRACTGYFKYGVVAPERAEDLMVVESQARRDLTMLVASLRTGPAVLHTVQCASVAPTLGVRSGRRGVGAARLSDDAVRFSKAASDGVALGFWPMEVWHSPQRPEVLFPEEGSWYEIPLGALCSQVVPGVYFAGRCLSASDYAIASARVMGTCLSTGFAAGWAAAGGVCNTPRERIVSALRSAQVEPFVASVSS